MKIGHFGPTFIFPGKTVNFFGVKHVAPSSTLKMRKSHKKSAHVYACTHAYTQLREGGGRSAPPGSYRVKAYKEKTLISDDFEKIQLLSIFYNYYTTIIKCFMRQDFLVDVSSNKMSKLLKDLLAWHFQNCNH